MTPEAFARYVEYAVKSYAEAHHKSGDSEPEEALDLAQKEYDRLLPDGLASPNQHLYSVFADGSTDPIGLLWFETRERAGKKSAYIYDIEMKPEARGKGYGTATLRALDAMLRERGIGRVSLYTMGWNAGARALYEREGFNVTGIAMSKVIA